MVTKQELYRNYMAAIDALGDMLTNYRSEGCADPECRVCKKSKAAEAQAKALVAFARKYFAEMAK